VRLQEVKGLLNDVEHQLRHLPMSFVHPLDDLDWFPRSSSCPKGRQADGDSCCHSVILQRRLPAPIETALYRVVQEALNNISKHAQAVSVRIRLRSYGKAVQCSITDDGVGLTPVR